VAEARIKQAKLDKIQYEPDVESGLKIYKKKVDNFEEGYNFIEYCVICVDIIGKSDGEDAWTVI
jgi:hypothetical protein